MVRRENPNVSNGRTRVALVTGANRGLGLETSRQLLAKSLSVVLTGRDDDALERAARGLDQDGRRAMTAALDVADVGSIEHTQRLIEQRFGRVDILYAPAYSMSKAALNAFTRILAHTYRTRGVLVNAVDPGWVRTDMGGPSAPRSPQEGADTIVWLATLPDTGPTGGFFRDRRAIEW